MLHLLLDPALDFLHQVDDGAVFRQGNIKGQLADQQTDHLYLLRSVAAVVDPAHECFILVQISSLGKQGCRHEKHIFRLSGGLHEVLCHPFQNQEELVIFIEAGLMVFGRKIFFFGKAGQLLHPEAGIFLDHRGVRHQLAGNDVLEINFCLRYFPAFVSLDDFPEDKCEGGAVDNGMMDVKVDIKIVSGVKRAQAEEV